MSHVTDTILLYGLGGSGDGFGSQLMPKINGFFENPDRGFVHVESSEHPHGWYGGTKALQANVAIGAFNYLDIDGLVAYLRAMDWEDVPFAQLCLQDEHDTGFTLIDIFREAE